MGHMGLVTTTRDDRQGKPEKPHEGSRQSCTSGAYARCSVTHPSPGVADSIAKAAQQSRPYADRCEGAALPLSSPLTSDVPTRVSQDDRPATATSPMSLPMARPEVSTTVVLNNLPRNYSREMLLALFRNQGFSGLVDFIFLPMDCQTQENKGYAFVNLVDCMVAAQFWDTFHGFSQWWLAWGSDVCEVSWSPLQGLEAQIECHRNSPLLHELVPDELKPAIFSEGVRCPFPSPTNQCRWDQEQAADEPIGVSQAACVAEISSDALLSMVPLECRTTVMLRNLPRTYTRDMLIDLFDNHGFADQYDFLFLPFDFLTHANQGYAKVNLISCIAAAQFWDTFHGFSRWWRSWQQEVCDASWAPEQGLQAHIHRYRNSPLMHSSVPDEFKPIMFCEGRLVPFPPPTRKVRAPRIRRLGGGCRTRGGK